MVSSECSTGAHMRARVQTSIEKADHTASALGYDAAPISHSRIRISSAVTNKTPSWIAGSSHRTPPSAQPQPGHAPFKQPVKGKAAPAGRECRLQGTAVASVPPPASPDAAPMGASDDTEDVQLSPQSSPAAPKAMAATEVKVELAVAIRVLMKDLSPTSAANVRKAKVCSMPTHPCIHHPHRARVGVFW